MIKVNDVTLVNPDARDWTQHRYVLALGAYGWTKVIVWANSLEDALDETVDWAREHAPGLLANDERDDAYREAIASGLSEHEAWEESLVDLTIAGNYGDAIRSDEWHIVSEDPSREEMLEILGRMP